jgi:YidC/Oxa1 family membrane protein insertase
MGRLFDSLISVLGSVLAFFFDIFSGFLGDGVSYGLAIVVLTIAINIVVFPLTLKQTRATRAFSALQPEIKKIQAEYKDDPQEMQKRLMAAQKEAGATPGGCLLPLLVQMPIWFALFRLLQTPVRYLVADPDTDRLQLNGSGLPVIDPDAIQPIDPLSKLGELLHRLGEFITPDNVDNFVPTMNNWVPGFDMHTFLGMNLGISPSEAVTLFGWVVAIPYLIMIVLMVATQYIQQWHSTYGQVRDPKQPGAGAQQAITKIMPLFIGFISWNFPAGLVVYWATSNLFRLGQQVLIFKIDGRPPSPGSGPKELDKPKNGPTNDDSAPAEPKKPQQGAADKRRRRRRR